MIQPMWSQHSFRLLATFGFNRLLSVLALSFLMGSISALCGQQVATTNLTGTIKDPNGALVAGAKVFVKNKDTGVSRDASSNDQGVFVITNLAAGSYLVKVEASGFAEMTVQNVDLE